MSRLDCLLVRLPEDDIGLYRFSESLGVGYLAAYLRRAGHRVEIVDGALDQIRADEIAGRILAARPRVVGFSVMFDGYDVAQQVLRTARSGGFHGHATMGQHFATFNAERILCDTPEIDSVVRFEGEQTALELLRAVQTGGRLDEIAGLAFRGPDGRPVVTQPRPLVDDLDTLPFPARDVLERNQDTVTTVNISASRGCPWRCKFCTITTFYREPAGRIWRHRSPANVVDELQEIVERYGRRPFFFVDDQFMGGGKRGRDFARDFGRELLARDLGVAFSVETRADTVDRESFELLKRAGLKLVFMGIESGYQPTLDRYQKDISVEENLAAIRVLQALDVDIQMGFIMFHEGTSMEEVKANLDFLEKAGAFDVVPFFNALKIHAGTAFMGETEGDLTADYQRKWEIVDPRARGYRARLEIALGPLMVPAYALRIDRRFLGSLRAPDIVRLERELRNALLHVARALFDAVEEDRASARLVEDLRLWSEQEAGRLQAEIAVARLLAGLGVAEPGTLAHVGR